MEVSEIKKNIPQTGWQQEIHQDTVPERKMIKPNKFHVIVYCILIYDTIFLH